MTAKPSERARRIERALGRLSDEIRDATGGDILVSGAWLRLVRAWCMINTAATLLNEYERQTEKEQSK